MIHTVEFKVGVLTLLAIVFFAWMILFVNDTNPLERRYRLQLVFTDIGLLRVGDLVRLNGISVGKVETMMLKDDRVHVVVAVDKEVNGQAVRIRKDAEFLVGNVGLFGTNYIKISQYGSVRNPEYYVDGDIIEGKQEAGFAELIQDGRSVIAQVQSTMRSLDSILADPELRKDLLGIVKNIRRTLDEVREASSSFRKRSDSILEKVADMSTTLAEATKTTSKQLETMLSETGRLSKELASTAAENRENLKTIVKDVRDLVARVANEGKFAADLGGVVTNLRSTTTELDRFIKDLSKDGKTAGNVTDVTARLKSMMDDMSAISAKTRSFVTDPQTERDIRQSFQDINTLATSVSSMQGKLDKLRFRLVTAMYFSDGQDDFRSDLMMDVGFDRGGFLRLGLDDVGDRGGLDSFQLGFDRGIHRYRAGIFADEFGVAYDRQLFRQSLELQIELRRPDDLITRLNANVRVREGSYLSYRFEEMDGGHTNFLGFVQKF